MDLNLERAKYNEKAILYPIISLSTQSIETDITATQEFADLPFAEIINMFTSKKFKNLSDEQLDELCQEFHIRFCNEIGVKPCNVRMEFFNEQSEDYIGRYAPETNEIVLNNLYLGFAFDIGLDVGFETMKNIMLLTAKQRTNGLVSKMLNGNKLTDLEKLVVTSKLMSASVDRLETLQGFKPHNYIVDELLKPEMYYAREFANCYALSLKQKGMWPEAFNKSLNKSLFENIDCLDNYKNGKQGSGLSAVIDNTKYTALKFNANFDGEITRAIQSVYSSIKPIKLYNEMKNVYALQKYAISK